MIVRIRRYFKRSKLGKMFSVSEHTASTQSQLSNGVVRSAATKKAMAKAALARARTIQAARAKALGWRVK